MNDLIVQLQTLDTNLQAIITALQALPTAPVVGPDDVEVDILLSDGSTKKFVPAPAAQ